MAQTFGISPEELRVRDGDCPSTERPLETAWTFWYDKKSSDKKESDQYMEGLKQLGSFNTIEGFYRHYTHLLRPSEFPRDQSVLLFRKGYKPMWEEFPEGGCWIIRIKRKASLSYVNRMWENLLLACIGEAFDMPDVVGCVLSTRLKDDVLSVWNLSNRDTPARFRIGEKLKEVLDLDMNALIQYKDHMQSLQDYSTYRNARNYMFAPSPTSTPLHGTLETPVYTYQGQEHHADQDLDQGALLPPATVDTEGFGYSEGMDTLLPPAAVDSKGFGFSEASWPQMSSITKAGFAEQSPSKASPGTQVLRSPVLSASATPWSPPLSAAAAPWSPPSMAASNGAQVPTQAAAAPTTGKSPLMSPSAAPWYPAGPSIVPTIAAAESAANDASTAPEAKPSADAHVEPVKKSWASVAAAAAAAPPKAKPQP